MKSESRKLIVAKLVNHLPGSPGLEIESGLSGIVYGRIIRAKINFTKERYSINLDILPAIAFCHC